jgi:hypothetical protein
MDNVYIGSGNLDGKGVYANRGFRKGEVVIKYNLNPLAQTEYNNLPSSEKNFVHTHHGKLFLYSEPERYVNHSDNPNTYQDIQSGCDITLRDIQKDEPITTDSSKDDLT